MINRNKSSIYLIQDLCIDVMPDVPEQKPTE